MKAFARIPFTSGARTLPGVIGRTVDTLVLVACAVLLAPQQAVASTDLDSRLAHLIQAQGLQGRAAFSQELPDPDAPVARLGRELFFSKTLSGNRDTACVSCHHPFLAGGDGLSLPVGVAAMEPELVGPGRRFDWRHAGALDPDASAGPNVARNSPTIINSAFYDRTVFLDGRVHRLGVLGIRSPESVRDTGRDLLAVQARLPVTAEDEMRGYRLLRHEPPDSVREVLLERLREHWQPAFAEAFGDRSAHPGSVNFERVEIALSDYQRSFALLDNSWFRYVAGEHGAISDAAKRGAADFLTPRERGGLGCVSCHKGDHFTDEQFHALAMPQIGRGKKRPAPGYGKDTVVDGTDFGRYEVTRRSRDRHAFRTPSLLNVAVTAPYGHAGTYVSLEEVIAHHLDPRNALASFDFSLKQLPQFEDRPGLYPRAPELTRAALRAWETAGHVPQTVERPRVADLVAFLHTLTDPCISSRSCLSRWMPDPASRAPDGQRLRARLRVAIAR